MLLYSLTDVMHNQSAPSALSAIVTSPIQHQTCMRLQGCSDVELPLVKQQRLDLGQEYHDPRLDDLEDDSVDNQQSRAHTFAPMLRRFLNSPFTEHMKTDPPMCTYV